MTESSENPRDRRSELVRCFLILVGFLLVSLLAPRPIPSDIILVSSLLALLLAWIALVDIQRFEIPDTTVMGLFVLAVLVIIYQDAPALPHHLLVGLSMAGAFWLLGEIHFRLRGHDGLGLGDAKLMGAVGMLLGFWGAVSVVFIAACAGVLTSMALRRRKLPFGAFLAFSTWIVWLYGPLVLFGGSSDALF